MQVPNRNQPPKQRRSPKPTVPRSCFPAQAAGPGHLPAQQNSPPKLTTQQSRVPTPTTDPGQAERSQSPEQRTEPKHQPKERQQPAPRKPPGHQAGPAVPPARRTSAVRQPHQVGLGVPRRRGPRGTRPRRTWRPSSCSGGPGRGPRCFPHPGTGRCAPTGYRTSVRSVSRVAAPASPLNPAGGIRARGAGHGRTGVVS